MKERPILFSAPMVRALLDGSKTQTRRAMKTQLVYGDVCGMFASWYLPNKANTGGTLYPNGKDAILATCPHGQPGDRLWVRETWGVISHVWDEACNLIDWVPDRPATAISEMPFGQGYYSGHVIYAADGAFEWSGDDDGDGDPRSAWHPSIHMPRRASRILLEIVSVRVEWLNDCSDADARAEGTPGGHGVIPSYNYNATPSEHYAHLWESINGAGSWAANPWVWVIEFKRVTP